MCAGHHHSELQSAPRPMEAEEAMLHLAMDAYLDHVIEFLGVRLFPVRSTLQEFEDNIVARLDGRVLIVIPIAPRISGFQVWITVPPVRPHGYNVFVIFQKCDKFTTVD